MLWSVSGIVSSWIAQEIAADLWSRSSKKTRRLAALAVILGGALLHYCRSYYLHRVGTACPSGWIWHKVSKRSLSAAEWHKLCLASSLVSDPDDYSAVWISRQKMATLAIGDAQRVQARQLEYHWQSDAAASSSSGAGLALLDDDDEAAAAAAAAAAEAAEPVHHEKASSVEIEELE